MCDVPAEYGILGVGALASAIVTGLCEEVDDPPSIVLSPRNAVNSARLAAQFDTVTVAAGNQTLVDDAGLVIACLRQSDADVLGELAWRPDQVVVSAMAGVSLRRLATVVAPAAAVRAVPMPEVATRSSGTPIHPPLESAVRLFDRLGGTLPTESNDQFEAVFTARGTVAPFLEYLNVLAEFLVDHGLSGPAAQRLLADTFSGVVSTLAGAEDTDFATIVRDYAPPGGGNAQLTELMRDSDVFDRMRTALDETHRRLTDQTQ